ncbi:protein-glutamine gamma-glutamyltransferase 4 isoform X1 [Thamnophis elegans]|uniref:protein-glutamine gamma-glutamyltransferase 4 isoform X1 n=2 Tax=Thamnophis elegans TaxID=35005 RepID=UPI00137890E5|nr:protein-glutamine gamma-glutamyltransferase 4 isoform X1 [Thamnophis elegans]XP_032091574.1 protein-glutamine gamma-glutamyltransferase 4 isoform X1 [Thamnophis elegans]
MSKTIGDPLRAVGVDFLRYDNTRLHHTNEFSHSSLIVRRGQEFRLKVTFSRELQDSDKVTLQLSIGHTPMPSNGTFITLNPRTQQDAQPWHANICQTNGKECEIVIASPADAIIGKYLLKVDTGSNIYSPTKNFIYILFNPWCQADSVFMPNDDERVEYILNDTGYIYVGSVANIRGRPWNFGQFEDDILDCCIYLLDKSQLKASAKKDPVIISRVMSALVNSEDDRGILHANWTGHYTGGTAPLAWTGSVPILQQYYRTQKSVLYGQCWVFSGVITTVMRCLGIPCRSVSNFASAHDTEENLKVDIYLDEKGRKIDSLTNDSVWNFHVWNEIWMKRLDLPSGFDGWQAIDATPQEKSQGIYQCGPSPVKAIKNGEVYLPYDSKFMFAAVNADKIFWRVKNENSTKDCVKLWEEIKAIGKNISTKAVGKNIREDITIQYKFLEGTHEERKSVETAYSFISKLSSHEAISSPNLLKANLKFRVEGKYSLWPGQPVDLNVIVENESVGNWTGCLAASCQLESYTGKVYADLSTIKQIIHTEGKPVIQIPWKITADTYMQKIMSTEDELLIKVNIIAEVQETNEKFTKQITLNFEHPPLKIEMADTAKVNQDFTCAFIFKNTLSIPLENCKLYVEGLGIFMMEVFDQGDIEPGKIFKSKIVCAPKKTGLKKIVAKLNSTQLKEITMEKIISIIE